MQGTSYRIRLLLGLLAYSEDCGLVVVQAEVRLLLLGERRNKERFCSVVEVLTSGQARLQLGRELAVYDKASMLGKQLTHLATSSNQGAECEVFTCGNLIRYYHSYNIIINIIILSVGS